MKKMKHLPHEQATDGLDQVVPEGDEFARNATDGGTLDVEGHRAVSFLPGMPGTGGDLNVRRPISGGEVADDVVEGHAMGHTKGERLNPGLPGTGGDQV